MPVALISVPGTCAQHVVRAPTCMPMPMFARGPHVSASVQQLCMNKFMCNLFKCVHKACGCRFRQSSQLVRSQLFPPSRSCPPHSPAPQFPHNLPTHNLSLIFVTSHKKPEFLNSARSPDAMFSSCRGQNRQLQMGFPCWSQF